MGKKTSPEMPSAIQWVSWIGATLVAAVMMTVFIYSNFQTKGEASEFKADLDKRLERIENKIDQILDKK